MTYHKDRCLNDKSYRKQMQNRKAIRKAKEVCGGGKGEEMGVMDHIILIVVPVTTWNKSTD